MRKQDDEGVALSLSGAQAHGHSGFKPARLFEHS